MGMTRRQFVGLGVAGVLGAALGGCAGQAGDSSPATGDQVANENQAANEDQSAGNAQPSNVSDGSGLGTFERGTQTERGMEVDDLLRNTPAGDIHFSLHVPEDYDGSAPYALYVHDPGWEGLYFQGVGANLQEDFAFVANDYVQDMIVVTPQLDDWGDTSARKTVALTRWFLANYNIDASRVYLSGYSGGGKTISLVMDQAPELYRRVLHMSSQWDGSGDALVAAQVPLRFDIGESDDYYGSGPARDAYAQLRQKYLDAGIAEADIDRLLTLDVKPASYFASFDGGQHAGGAALFAHDADIMGWLFQ